MKAQLIARFFGSDTALCTEVGQREGQVLVSTGQAGYLLYGPYMTLEPGHYLIELYGSANAASVADAFADVCVETGQRILTQQRLQATADGRQDGLLAPMTFTVGAGCQDMEVRVHVGPDNNIYVGLVEIYKIADISRIGIVVVTYGDVPALLVNSINSSHVCKWYIHHHGSELLNDEINKLFRDKESSLHFHCENRGLSKSWNDGIIESAKSENDITIVINDDVEFLENGFDDWVEFILAHRNHGLIFLMGEEPQDDGTVVVRSQDFACFSFGIQASKLVGAFDENFSPAYYEDVDYIVRASLVGISIYTDERVLCRHKRSSTQKNNIEISGQLPIFLKTNRDYMITKWGSDTGTYAHPFNDPTNSIYIPFREAND